MDVSAQVDNRSPVVWSLFREKHTYYGSRLALPYPFLLRIA